MSNPTNKQELLDAMADSYAKLNEQIAKMSEEAVSAPFDFAADPKKCGVRWQYAGGEAPKHTFGGSQTPAARDP